MSNNITAYFKGRVGVCESVYQHDYGLVLILDDIDFGTSFDVYFEIMGEVEAIPAVGQNDRVAIPNSCLTNAGMVKLHIPIHSGENDSEVEYVVEFKVIGRAKPVDDGTPADQVAIAQAIAALQEAKRDIPEDLQAYYDSHIAPNIEGYVNDWLDDHPEATTTVQDGSLTEQKFSDETKLKVLKDYVTPEMFGAKSDGVTDDAVAINLALKSGKPVVLRNTTYYTATPIIIGEDNIVLDLRSTINYSGNLYAVTCGGNGGFNVEFGNINSPNGIGIELVKGSGQTNIQNAIIKFNRISSKSHCIDFTPDGIYRVYYTNIYGLQCDSAEGNGINIDITNGSYFNENRFYNIRINSGTWGVYAKKSSDYIDRLYFENIGLEVPDSGFYFYSVRDSVINSVRIKEVFNNNADYVVFNFDGTCQRDEVVNIDALILTGVIVGQSCYSIKFIGSILTKGYVAIGTALIVDYYGNKKVELLNNDIVYQPSTERYGTFTAPIPTSRDWSFIPKYYVLPYAINVVLDSEWYGFGKINDITFYNNADNDFTMQIQGVETRNITIPSKKAVRWHRGESYSVIL